MATKFEKALEKNIEKQSNTAQAPRGYKLVREGKSWQTSFVLRESTRAGIDEIRAEKGISRNELVNDILEKFIENYFKEREEK